MTFSIFEIVGDLSSVGVIQDTLFGTRSSRRVPSAMEFLDMEKITSILCLFVCLFDLQDRAHGHPCTYSRCSCCYAPGYAQRKSRGPPRAEGHYDGNFNFLVLLLRDAVVQYCTVYCTVLVLYCTVPQYYILQHYIQYRVMGSTIYYIF